jgi:hypothetical protein
MRDQLPETTLNDLPCVGAGAESSSPSRGTGPPVDLDEATTTDAARELTADDTGRHGSARATATSGERARISVDRRLSLREQNRALQEDRGTPRARRCHSREPITDPLLGA